MKIYLTTVLMSLMLLVSCGKDNKVVTDTPIIGGNQFIINNGQDFSWRFPDVVNGSWAVRRYLKFEADAVTNTSVCYYNGQNMAWAGVRAQAYISGNTVDIVQDADKNVAGCVAQLRRGSHTISVSGNTITLHFPDGSTETGTREANPVATYTGYNYNYNGYNTGYTNYNTGINAGIYFGFGW